MYFLQTRAMNFTFLFQKFTGIARSSLTRRYNYEQLVPHLTSQAASDSQLKQRCVTSLFLFPGVYGIPQIFWYRFCGWCHRSASARFNGVKMSAMVPCQCVCATVAERCVTEPPVGTSSDQRSCPFSSLFRRLRSVKKRVEARKTASQTRRECIDTRSSDHKWKKQRCSRQHRTANFCFEAESSLLFVGVIINLAIWSAILLIFSQRMPYIVDFFNF